jgi:hypothetical protein
VVSLASLTLMDSFFTIAFASFVEGQHDFSQTFSGWLKVSLSLFFWNASQVAYRLLGCRQGQRFTSRSMYAYSFIPLIPTNISVRSCFYANHLARA